MILVLLLLIILATCLTLYYYYVRSLSFSSHASNKNVPPIQQQQQQQRDTLYPPPFPVITRTPTIQLSPEAMEMCTRTLWHTVETTTIVLPNEETFIHTGDIDDLWLRVRNYLFLLLVVPVFSLSLSCYYCHIIYRTVPPKFIPSSSLSSTERLLFNKTLDWIASYPDLYSARQCTFGTIHTQMPFASMTPMSLVELKKPWADMISFRRGIMNSIRRVIICGCSIFTGSRRRRLRLF